MLTREQFQEEIKLAILDMKDPNGDYQDVVREGKKCAEEFQPHDPVLAGKIETIVVAIEQVGAYLKSRAEQ